jgi:sialidase-1
MANSQYLGTEEWTNVTKSRIQSRNLFNASILLVLLTVCSSCKKEDNFRGGNSACVNENVNTIVRKGDPFLSERLIFKAGDNGYQTYRIPAIITTKTGVIIAFCEGRKNNREDYGDIDLVAKRSLDNGKTWGPLQVLWDDGGSTCGNPTPVVDQITGTIWLFMSWNSATKSQFPTPGYDVIDTYGDRRLFSMRSDDEGLSWTNLTDHTLTLTPDHYTWDAVGPGNGIQSNTGPYKNRLLVPAQGRTLYSDDNGTTWNFFKVPAGTSEGTIVEHCDGTLMRNDRSAGPFINEKKRIVSVSKDFGETWSAWKTQPDLPDPICQASVIRADDENVSRLIFINPTSNFRTNMTVKISYNNGQTWPITRQIQGWLGGYSSLCVTKDGMIASLQEFQGVNLSIEPAISIWFRKFNISWVLDGRSEPVE